MPYGFGDQLDLLYASYSRTPLFDSEKVRNWREIRESAEQNTLNDRDWQVIRSMYQAVAQWEEKNGEEWFQYFSRWFGAANHSTKLPRTEGTIEGSFTEGKRLTVASEVDPDRLGVLLYIYGLAPIDSPMAEGLSRYLVLNPDLRSHFTDEMLVVEQALLAIERIRPEDVTPELKRKLCEPVLPAFLRLTFVDQKDLLFEHDSLPILLYNTLLNSIWEGKSINVYRVHINMTTLNEQDDTGELGNVYLRVVRGWFQEKFGTVHVVQNPERTTFEFVASSANFVRSVMSNYEIEVRQRIATTPGVQRSVTEPFVPRAVLSERTLSRENLYRYAIRTREDLEAFRAVIEFGGRSFSVERWMEIADGGGEDIGRVLSMLRIDFEEIRKGSHAVRKTLNALIVKAALELNAELAAQTSFFEREFAGNGADGNTGTPLFLEDDLPKSGSEKFAKWEDFRSRKVGYVGPGQYDPTRHNPELADPRLSANLFFSVGTPSPLRMMVDEDATVHPLVNHLLRIIPRLAHVKGQLSHTRAGSDGGLLEQFNNRLHRLSHLPNDTLPEEVGARLGDLKRTAKALLEELKKFYALAVTDPRNTWTAKQHREFPLHRGNVTENFRTNFFVQEVALSGNRYLAALEYDSFRAFNERHARHDDTDSDYNRVRDAVFVVAKKMNMAMPIVNPSGGDHISISFSDKDLRGVPIDPMVYCKRVQLAVRETFADKPFQDYHKVRIHEFRLQVAGAAALPKATGKAFAESMRRDLDLQARPTLRAVGASEILVSLPLENVRGCQVSVAEVIQYLRKKDVETTLKDQPSVHIARLPMWIRSNELEKEWFFGAEPPPEFIAFNRTLTVTMALGEHCPLRRPADVAHFVSTEDAVSTALGEAKRTSWPHKEGFVDFRSESPMHQGTTDVHGAAPVSLGGRVADAVSSHRVLPAPERSGDRTPKAFGNLAVEMGHADELPSETHPHSLEGRERENGYRDILRRLAALQGLADCHSFLPRLTEAHAAALIRLSGSGWRQILIRQGFADEAVRLDRVGSSLSATQKAALALAAVARSRNDVENLVGKWTESPTGLPAAPVPAHYGQTASPSVFTNPSLLVR